MPVARWSLAKVTSRMLFAVATPMLMIAPISDGTLNVVCVTNSIQRMPASAPGSAIRMMNGSSQRLEVHHHQQVHQQDREDEPEAEADERGCACSPPGRASSMKLPAGSLRANALTTILSTSRATPPRSRSCTLA